MTDTYPSALTDPADAADTVGSDVESDWLDDSSEPNAGDAISDEESYLDEDSTGLWEGDRGSLDAKQRDTLVLLLKKAFISSDDRAEWRTLVRDPGPIVTSLNNLYFNLVLDTRSEVAYATPARTADNPFKTLVKDGANNREETLILIYMRERYRASTAAGETHVFADATAMYDYVQRFRPDSATDHSGDERKVTNAIASLLTSGLLVKTKDDGRYRVHRAIEALLPLTKLTHLLEAFRRLNEGTVDGDAADSGDAIGELDDSDTHFDADQPARALGKHAALDTSGDDLERATDEVAAERIDAQGDLDVAEEDA